MSVTVKQLRDFLASIPDDVLVQVKREDVGNWTVTTEWADPDMDSLSVTDFCVGVKPDHPYFGKKFLFIEGE